jgi:dihydropteroate synthase
LKGASILRVHDVKEAKQAITLVQAIAKKESIN